MTQNKQPENPLNEDQNEVERCPNCDSVLTISNDRCLMCGIPIAGQQAEALGTVTNLADDSNVIQELPENRDDEIGEVETDNVAEEQEEITALLAADDVEFGEVNQDEIKKHAKAEENLESYDNGITELQSEFESILIEERSGIPVWLVGLFILIIGILGAILLSAPGQVTLAILPTVTESATPIALTPTWTPLATNTSEVTPSPTTTQTPRPSETPQPPRVHQVASGETLFSLSLRYGVTMDSIADVNGMDTGSAIQVSQNLLIPWPTATPPLEPVAIRQGEQLIIADPTDCQMYEIKSGDTFLGIAHRERIELEALTAVNRFTDQTILQPGDLICIPKIVVGGELPPTAGPSPTPSDTPPPQGPALLYPIEGAIIDPPDQSFYLQWVAVKDLEPDEWYMVELTDLSTVDSHPIREFTRKNSIRVPISWRPEEESTHLFRWRVRIVRVTGQRSDESFIYTFGGSNSDDALFYWRGAVRTPTAIPISTASPTP